MTFFIDILRDTEDANVPTDRDFEVWATAALKGRKLRGEVCIRIVSPEESQQLNHEYRGKDYPTNVLSFPFEGPPGVPVDLLGDLAICAAVVEKEATEQNKPVSHHWAHMVIHGCLHLIGFDHINDDEAEEMEALETSLLASLNIPDPYQQGE